VNAGRPAGLWQEHYARRTSGTFAQKFKNCKECDFYISVREEEGANFGFPRSCSQADKRTRITLHAG